MKSRKKRQKTIDMTKFGPVDDVSGIGRITYPDNIGNVLHELHTKHANEFTWQTEILITVSDVFYNKEDTKCENPKPVTKKERYTVGYLVRLWGKKFTIEEYEKEKLHRTH